MPEMHSGGVEWVWRWRTHAASPHLHLVVMWLHSLSLTPAQTHGPKRAKHLAEGRGLGVHASLVLFSFGRCLFDEPMPPSDACVDACGSKRPGAAEHG